MLPSARFLPWPPKRRPVPLASPRPIPALIAEQPLAVHADQEVVIGEVFDPAFRHPGIGHGDFLEDCSRPDIEGPEMVRGRVGLDEIGIVRFDRHVWGFVRYNQVDTVAGVSVREKVPLDILVEIPDGELPLEVVPGVEEIQSKLLFGSDPP